MAAGGRQSFVPASLGDLPADAAPLMQALADRVDDGMLREIAEADYGRDVEAHLAALRGIRDSGRVPHPLPWEPREVLELTRWSDPDNPAWCPGDLRLRAHWMRAFACAALLRAFGGSEDETPGSGPMRASSDLEGQNQTLIQLIDSLEVLDTGLDRAAASFLLWLLGRLPDDEPEEHPFFGLGLLWLALRMTPPVEDAPLVALMDWISEREDAVGGRWRQQLGVGAHGRWLLGNTTYTQRHDAWRAFGRRLGALPMPGRAPKTIGYVRLLAAMLAGD